MTELWRAPKDALLLNVDLTGSFLPPDGSLKVEHGDEVIPVVNALVSHFEHVAWTKEEHIPGHPFFASSHEGKQPLDTIETEFGTQYLWPDHSIVGTDGAAFQKDLNISENDMIVVKGTDPNIHAYSAVYMDDRKTVITYEDGKTLTQKFEDAGIKRVAVTGLAYDFCAGMTAYDLAKEGFEVFLVKDATRPIGIPVEFDEGGVPTRTTTDIMDEMLAEAGVKVVNAAELSAAFALDAP